MEHLAGFLRPAGALPLKSLELTPPGLSRLPTPAPAEFHACIKAMVAHRRQLNAWWNQTSWHQLHAKVGGHLHVRFCGRASGLAASGCVVWFARSRRCSHQRRVIAGVTLHSGFG